MVLGKSIGRPTTRKSFELIIKNFVKYAKINLNIRQDIPLVLIDDLEFTKRYQAFACIMSDSRIIYLSIVNRHPVDILRSLAHEIVHYKQLIDGQTVLGHTGSRHENEANAKAGVIMREYGKLHPELFDLMPLR